MALLTKDAIKVSVDLKTQVVPVPEWGGDVCVRGLTGAERDAFEGSMYVGEAANIRINVENLRARLVVLCCVDEAGERIFDDGDLGWLGNKSGAALDRVYTVAQRLSGLTKKDIADLEKN